MSSTEGKVISCRAAVLWKEGTPLSIETITVDPPEAGEVRVRNVAAGVCASDAHFLWNQETDLKLDFDGLPVVLGHEGSAIVESVGAGVKGVSVGDHVIPLFIPNCDRCALCANPRTNQCADANFATLLRARDGSTRLRIDGRPLLSFCGTNTFGEYAVLRESQICKVSPDVDLKTACIIGCAVGTGFGSARRLAGVHAGATCAVWGLGAIGLSTTLACRLAGAGRVIGIDVNSGKRKFAEEFGCHEFVNPRELERPLEEWLRAEGGVDYAFDCVGNIAALRTGLSALTAWGTLVCVGLGPSGHSLEIPVSDLLAGQRLLGGYFANEKSRRSVVQLVEEFARGELPIGGLITHRFPLDAINEAFDLLRDGKSVRAVIDFDL